MRRALVIAIVLVLVGCKSDKKQDNQPVPGPASGTAGGSATASGGSGAANPDDEATAVEPDTGSDSGSAAKPHGPMKPTADLTLTGAVTAKLAGTAGTCACHDDTANITIRSDDLKITPSFELNVLVTEPAEWSDPAVVINVKAPQRGSYGRNRVRHGPDDKLEVAKDCSRVTIEHVVLKGVATKGDVTLVGTITCGP